MVDNYLNEETLEWRELLMIHKFAVDEMRTRLNNLDEEFQTMHDYNPIEHISYRVKNPDRIREKLERIGLDPSVENAKEHLFDVAGIRIICAFTADIFDVFKMIEAQSDLKILQVKDYIAAPKENGYKSLHVHVQIPVYLSKGVIETRVEIQLRTIAMDFWASVEHKLYYKYKGKSPTTIQAELKECADLISELDNRMYTLKKLILCLENNSEEVCLNDLYVDEYFKEA